MWLLQVSCRSGWLTACWACSRLCGNSSERREQRRRRGSRSTWLLEPENTASRSALCSKYQYMNTPAYLENIFLRGKESTCNLFWNSLIGVGQIFPDGLDRPHLSQLAFEARAVKLSPPTMIRVRNVGFLNCYAGYFPLSPTGEQVDTWITLYTFIHHSIKCVSVDFFIAQDSRVTLKRICVDGIKTTATILTGRCFVGWTTPLGLVGLFKRTQNHTIYIYVESLNIKL